VNRLRRLALGGSLLIALALTTAACEPALEPAPKDIDGLAHWLWVNYLAANDEEMADALKKVHTVADFAAFDEPLRMTITDLEQGELAVVEMEDRDPKPAVGMLVTNVFDCTIDKLEPVLYALDQGAKYPELYDTYSREYTSDLGAFQAREANTISWTFTYEATPMPASRYRTTSNGQLRYVPDIDSDVTPFGDFLLQRIWMPQPVAYLETDANEFTLDFQLEVYYQLDATRVAHFYPVWRHMAFNGVGASTDDDWVQDTIIGGLLDFDIRTEELCQGQ